MYSRNLPERRRPRREREDGHETARRVRRADVVADELPAGVGEPRVARRDGVQPPWLRPRRAAVARADDRDAERARRCAARPRRCGRTSRSRSGPRRSDPPRSPERGCRSPVPGTRVRGLHVVPSVEVVSTIVLPSQPRRNAQSAHATSRRPDASTAAVGRDGARSSGWLASISGAIRVAAANVPPPSVERTAYIPRLGLDDDRQRAVGLDQRQRAFGFEAEGRRRR